MVDEVSTAITEMELALMLEMGKQLTSVSRPADPPSAEEIAAAIVVRMGTSQPPPTINTEDIAKAVSERITQGTTQKASYANIVKVPNALQVTTSIPPPLHSVVVFPELATGKEPPPSSETRRRVMESLKPVDTGIQIAAVRNLGRSGGILISTTSAAAQSKLLSHPALSTDGLRTEPAKRDLPRLKIFDVPKELDAAGISHAIRSQNLDHLSEVEFNKQFKIVHTFASKIRNNIAIAECTPEIRQTLLQQGRIYVHFESCRVLDHIQVTRCFKCQAFGHPSKYCGAQEDTCSLCAGPHFYTACPNKDTPANHKCANCTRAKMEDLHHSALSTKCPAYSRALDMSIRKTDYGAI
ncbi:hypothetical protein RI129_003363 [Pyrocoelia pectoralis]|uniref:Gag-like protein n=1 Tax=Pyrocoelia pectoralis TaxID=417401 RepID=A0AAN7ZUF6_9COLE